MVICVWYATSLVIVLLNLCLDRLVVDTLPVQALAWVREIRLLTPNQVKAFFPDANVVREKYFGLTKSLMAISRAK
jgi:hypothetical protein